MIKGIIDNSVHLVGTIAASIRPWGARYDTGIYFPLCVKSDGGKDNLISVYMRREEINFKRADFTVGKEIVVDGFLNGSTSWHSVIAESIKPKNNLNLVNNHFDLAGTLVASVRDRSQCAVSKILNLNNQLHKQYSGLFIVGSKLKDVLKEIKEERIKIEGEIKSDMDWQHLVSNFELKTNILKRV